jgi:hypothetical protein
MRYDKERLHDKSPPECDRARPSLAEKSGPGMCLSAPAYQWQAAGPQELRHRNWRESWRGGWRGNGLDRRGERAAMEMVFHNKSKMIEIPT